MGSETSKLEYSPLEAETIRMSRRYYVETTPEGQHRFVALKRSRSHHHHHHHRCHREHDHCCVSKNEWADLVERERCLRETNMVLTRENRALKGELQTVEVELRRYQGWVPNLRAKIKALVEENLALRRALDDKDKVGAPCKEHFHELERLRQKLCRAEDEIVCLRSRVRDLLRRGQHSISDRIEELNRKVKDWICKFEVVDEHNRRLRRDLDRQRRVMDEQYERIEAYERMLIKHGLMGRC